MANNETNDIGGAKGAFGIASEKWEGLAAEAKTPAFFAELFGCGETGAFNDSQELAQAIGEIERLVKAQSQWTDEEREAVFDRACLEAEEAIEAERPSMSDSLWEENVLSWNPLFDFRPQGMGNNAIFKRGTFNIIGARPGCGKTTFAIKLLADALEWKDDSRVIFLSYEEETKDIYTRIYSHLIFRKAKREGKAAQLPKEDVFAAIYEAVKHPESARLGNELSWARERVRALEKARRLKVFDFDGAAIGDIERALRLYPKAVVIIDYLQLIEADPQHMGNELAGLKDISKRLARLAKARQQIVITLAQLKRYGQQDSGDSDRPSQLTVDRLKDCGQFEQDAALVIELGENTEWENDEREEHGAGEPFFFWKIVKNRRLGGRNRCCLFDTSEGAMAYSCMGGTETPAGFLDAKPKDEAKGKGNAKRDAQGGGAKPKKKGFFDGYDSDL